MYRTDWDSDGFKELDVTEQLIALTASAAQLAYENGDGVLPETASEVDEGAEFVIPLLIPEELESGDGRSMEKGALSTRNLPITLLWQPATGQGHDNSYVVGRIDTIEEIEGGLGNARGVFDTGPYGREAERLVRAKMLRGVSADLDMFEATVDAAGEELAEDFDPAKVKGEKIKSEKMTVNKARVMAATLVAKPAFQECTIELVTNESMDEDPTMEDGVYEELPPDSMSTEYAVSTIIASAAPLNPPQSWFENPELDTPTPLTVTDDGKVFGHIATWDMNHVGHASRVSPPRSRSNYAYFRTGLVKTIEGEDVAVGQLTLAGGHAGLDADAALAVKHYDDTASAVADVTAGEDQFGIWVAGGLRPGVTPEQVRVLRASAPSGDWRPINGVLELVAVCQVNVPGFPVARARVASGAVMALVAAGAQTLHRIRRSETDELAQRVDAMERQLLERRKTELSTGIVEARKMREQRLREAASNARAAFAPQLERKAQLAADAEVIRARFAEFKLGYKPDFKEQLHPRNDHGQFREVLLKLSDILKGPDGSSDPDAVSAKDDLEKAAQAEDAGDNEGARAAAEQAKNKLERAASKADADPASKSGDALHDVVAEIDGGPDAHVNEPDPKKDDEGGSTVAKKAVDVVKKVGEKVGDVVTDVAKGDAPADGKAPEDITREDLPPEIKDFIDTMIDELGENADPKTILSRMDNSMKHWLEGKGFESPEDMAKVIEKMMVRPIQPDIGQ